MTYDRARPDRPEAVGTPERWRASANRKQISSVEIGPLPGAVQGSYECVSSVDLITIYPYIYFRLLDVFRGMSQGVSGHPAQHVSFPF